MNKIYIFLFGIIIISGIVVFAQEIINSDSKKESTLDYKDFNLQKNISFDCTLDKNGGLINCNLPDTRTALISIHGTEYTQGQDGTVFVQVLDSTGQPFNQSILCELEIYAPNKTRILDVGMFKLNATVNNGIFYYDLTPVPEALGIYILSVNCAIPVVSNSSKEFLRQNASLDNYLNNQNGNNAVINTVIANPSTFTCTTSDLYEEIGNFTHFSYIDTINATMLIDKTGGGTADIDMKFIVYKFKLNTLETTIISAVTLFDQVVSPSIIPYNFTAFPKTFLKTDEVIGVDICFKAGSGTANVNTRLHFNGNTSTSNSSITKFTFIQNVSIGYQEIRGSGELHISNSLSNIISDTILLCSYIDKTNVLKGLLCNTL